jgi:outer membrane biogenesis lipoprotein LolB
VRVLKALLCATACAALLNGCASLPARDLGGGVGTPSAKIERWEGRFSANIEPIAGNRNNDPTNATPSIVRQSVAGRFLLEQTLGQTTVLELYSPLGQLSARLEWAQGKARLQLAGKEPLNATSMDELSETALGWRVPLERLPIWLRGQAASNSQFDPNGRLIAATDKGWRLLVDDWMGPLPKRLNISWPDGEPETRTADRSVRLRLILDSPTAP